MNKKLIVSVVLVSIFCLTIVSALSIGDAFDNILKNPFSNMFNKLTGKTIGKITGDVIWVGGSKRNIFSEVAGGDVLCKSNEVVCGAKNHAQSGSKIDSLYCCSPSAGIDLRVGLTERRPINGLLKDDEFICNENEVVCGAKMNPDPVSGIWAGWGIPYPIDQLYCCPILKAGIEIDYDNKKLVESDVKGVDIECGQNEVVCGAKNSPGDKNKVDQIFCCPVSEVEPEFPSPLIYTQVLELDSNQKLGELMCQSNEVVCGAKNSVTSSSKLDKLYCCSIDEYVGLININIGDKIERDSNINQQDIYCYFDKPVVCGAKNNNDATLDKLYCCSISGGIIVDLNDRQLVDSTNRDGTLFCPKGEIACGAKNGAGNNLDMIYCCPFEPTIDIGGRVVDSNTGSGIGDVSVNVQEYLYGIIKHTTTDTNGYFKISGHIKIGEEYAVKINSNSIPDRYLKRIKTITNERTWNGVSDTPIGSTYYKNQFAGRNDCGGPDDQDITARCNFELDPKPCTSDLDCTDPTPICDINNNVCVGIPTGVVVPSTATISTTEVLTGFYGLDVFDASNNNIGSFLVSAADLLSTPPSAATISTTEVLTGFYGLDVFDASNNNIGSFLVSAADLTGES